VLQGQDVVDVKAYGYMDLERKYPLAENAIFRMYSNTKLITSVAAMMLVEQGRFALDDAVAQYLPQFAQPKVLRQDAATLHDVVPAAAPITIRHLMSHSAGLTYDFLEPESVLGRAYVARELRNPQATLADLTEQLAALPLCFHPGTNWRYSFATDVIARLIEVVSGQRFDVFLQEHIFQPLGMLDTDFYVPSEKHERCVTMYAPSDPLKPMQPGLYKCDDPFTGQFSQPRAMLSGGGGLCSTLADYLAFVRMLIGNGEWNGARILQPETLRLMRQNQLPAGVHVKFPLWQMPDTVFGLGFALKTAPATGEPAVAIDEYHWGGLAGTHSWMAPRANFAGICLTQRMPGFWHPFSHDFKRLVYAAVTA
jgi:CubicO group peptidase (beta-lactamase class C family)